jgi:CHAT domain-containing protein/tetratricopeptide (TPR) repeat protein
MMRYRLLVCLALLAAGWVTATSHAQESRAEKELQTAVQQAETYRKAGRIDDAIAEYRKAVTLAARAYGGMGDLRTVTLLDKLAALYTAKGQPKQAEFLCKRSLEIREAKLPADHSLVAASLDHLAGHYRRQADFDRAEPLYQRSLKIYEAKDDHTLIAQTLSNLAAVYSGQGDHQRAEPLLLRSLELRKKHLNPEHLDVARSLNNLAALYRSLGDYVRTEPLLQEALRIRQQQRGDSHPDVARSLNNLGQLYQLMGRHDEAEDHYQRSLKILEQELGKNHPDTAATLGNLGLLHAARGEFDRAEPLLERSLKTLETARGKDHPDVAQALNNLALFCRSVGQTDRARTLYERSLKIRETALGDDHPDVAQSLSNLANLHSDAGRLDEAERSYGKGLTIQEARLGKNHPTVAQTLHNLANLQSQRDRLDEAEPLYLRALQIQQARLGKSHPEVAQTLNDLATLRRAKGDFDQAESLYQQSLQLFEASLDADHHHRAQALANLMLLKAGRGDWRGAAQLTDQARHIVRRHVARVLPGLAEPEQLLFLNNHYQPALHTALSLGLESRNDPALAELSAAWVVNGKAVAQQALAEPVLAARDSRDPKLASVSRQLRTVRAQLAALGLQSPSPGKEAERRQQLARLVAQEQALVKRLGQAAGSQVRGDPWVEVDEVRKSLPERAVLVEIARLRVRDFASRSAAARWRPEHYAAWIIAPRGDVKIIDLGPAETIEAALQSFYETLKTALKDVQRLGETAAEQKLRQRLDSLAQLALHPLLPHLQGHERWIISGDASLCLAPWAALPLPEGKYALEKHRISHLVSGRDLVSAASSLQPGAAVVMADPDYDLKPPPAATAKAPQRRSLEGLSVLRNAPRLPGTAAEARAITPRLRTYTRAEPEVYLQQRAQEEVFKSLRRPRVLVLSTHGFFLDAPAGKSTALSNPLLRCGLLLAGCNRDPEASSSSADDGVLTGLEIVGSDLRGTELVVLSACETAVGQVREGEGVAGLRQAFQLAGARNVVASLWQVPDKETADLMTAFFANLAAGQDQAEALRAAQLSLLQQRRQQRGAGHPFYWAAFNLTGR